MTGLEPIERIKKALYSSSIIIKELTKEDNEIVKAIDIIERELKAFHIIFKKFMTETLESDLINSTPEDFKKMYRTKGEEVKSLFTEEEYIYVLTVLKEVLQNDRT